MSSSLIKANKIDMLQGSLWDKILLFAIPIAASSILQQLFNSADIAVVGQFADKNALAAVGANGPVINFLVNILLGLSSGTNVVVATCIGRGQKDNISSAVHTSILLSILTGIILTVAGCALAAPVLNLTSIPPEVLPKAVLYLRIYFLGIPFISLYNFGSAILRSRGDTKRPLYSLIFSGALNVVLNVFLVVFFKMDVAGVAIATVISNVLSCLMILYFLAHEKDEFKLQLKKLSFNKGILNSIFKIGIPAGIQGVVFSFSNICVQSAINSLGASAIAGSAAELNYELITYYIALAFNQTALSFTSQNFGAGNVERCKKVFKLCMTFSVAVMGFLIFFFVVFRRQCISIYTPDSVAIKYGMRRMLIVEALDVMICSYEITASCLRAIGHSLLPAVLTIFGVCVIRVVWINTVFKIWHNYDILMAVYPVSWVITGTLILSVYFYIRKKEFKKLQSISV